MGCSLLPFLILLLVILLHLCLMGCSLLPFPLLFSADFLRISHKIRFSVRISLLFLLILLLVILLHPLRPYLPPSKGNWENKGSSLICSIRLLLPNWHIVICIVILVVICIVHGIAPRYIHLVHHYSQL